MDVSTENGVKVTNSTAVTLIGEHPSFHCNNETGIWIFPDGTVVPERGPVYQVVNRTSKILIFDVGFDSEDQGLYQCSLAQGMSSYVGLFISSELAPRDVIITLEKYPIADVTWKDPLVGSGPVDMYKVAVVVPQGHAPLLVDKHTNNIKLEAHTSSRGAFLLSITIAAIYGFKLEGITLNRNIIPPPSNFTGGPIPRPGSVKLKWDHMRGVILSGYEVEFWRSGSKVIHTLVVVVGQTSVTIDRLLSGEYTFTLQAKPSGSDSLPFKSNPIKIQPYSVPGTPTSVMVTAPSLTEVTVSWRPPKHTGGFPILRYYLSFGTTTITVDGSHSLSHTFAQLNPDSSYILSIQAENKLGRGGETPQREIFPRQTYEQTRSLPLEIIIPSIIGGLLLVVAFGISVVFYTAIRKRKNRFRLSVRKDDSKMTKEVDLSQSTEERAVGNHGDEVTPHRGSHTFNTRSTTSVAVSLRPTASFNIPSRNAITHLPASDTMTTDATYLRTSQLHGFSASRESVDYDTIVVSPEPPPLPSTPPGQMSRQPPGQMSRQPHGQVSRQLPRQTPRESARQTTRQQTSAYLVLGKDVCPLPAVRPPLPPFKGAIGRSLSVESFYSSCSSYEDLDPTTLDQSQPGYAKLHRPKHVYDSLRMTGNNPSGALCLSLDNISSHSSSDSSSDSDKGSGPGRTGSGPGHTGSGPGSTGSGPGSTGKSPIGDVPHPPHAEKIRHHTSPRKQYSKASAVHNQLSLPRSEVCSVAAYSYELPLPVNNKPLIPPNPPPRP